VRRSLGRRTLYGYVALVAALLVIPAVIIIPMSFSAGDRLQFPPAGFSLRWYRNFFASSEWTSAALTSLEVALLTVAVTTVLGCAMAFGLVRGRFRGRSLIGGLVLGPMIVPLVVLSTGIFYVFARWGLAGTLLGLVIAHTVLALPFVVITCASALQTIDPWLELAAQGLGARPLSAFLRITTPLLLPALAVGALFAFMTSWNEVVVALFLTGPFFQTLPIVIWSQLQFQIDPTVAAVSTMLIVMTTLTMAFVALVRKGAFLPT
jgi:putative spermidine/putrescine transport system permease protein